MAYIGNAKTPLLYASNVRDDIVPDGVASSFTLSQEVPGGYENNIVVIRRKYLLEDIVVGNVIDFDGTAEKITLIGSAGAAASTIQGPIPNIYPGDNVVITGASNAQNNGTFPVLSVTYNGTTCEIFLDGNLVTETGTTITLVCGKIGPWEILEAEIDYTIGGTGPDYNKIISFAEVPQIDDTLYVLHRGDATYNFVPTTASVGPEQLQQNLRNFTCDRFTGNGAQTVFILSQFAVNSKTLLVTVNGDHKDGDDPDQSFIGDWTLAPNGLSITFAVAPANLSKIKILHLGFSTVSRRAALSPGQVGAIAPNSITSTQLAPNSVTSSELDAGAVTTSKIAADAVDGSKILLNNEENLRGKDFGGTPRGLLRITASDATAINSQNDTLIQSSGTTRLRLDVTNNALVSETHNNISLGTPAKRYSALYVQGTTRTGATEVDSLQVNASATVVGNIVMSTPGATVDGVDLTALQASLVALQAQVNTLVPVGSMRMWMVDGPAPTGYLLCQGQVVSQTTFAALFAVIGTTFNIGGEGGGNFRLPDLRQRFPIGKAASGTGSGWGPISGVGGAIDHAHIGGAHTHDMSNHTHILPGHYHGMGSGADLNISTSGTHTTSIQHNHGNFTIGPDGLHDHDLSSGHAITISTVGNHSHDQGTLGTNTTGSHSHTITVDSANASHSHTATSNSAGSHSHSIDCNGTSNSSHNHDDDNSGTGSTKVASGVGSGSPTSVSRDTNNGGSHSHTITVDNANANHGHTASSGDTGNHSHTISGNTGASGSHSHTISGQVHNYGSGHYHNVDVPDTGSLNSSSDGQHSHTSGNFAGRIGNVSSGNDGNGNITSGVPSAANTGSSGVVSTTTNNPPFHTVHFIIKT